MIERNQPSNLNLFVIFEVHQLPRGATSERQSHFETEMSEFFKPREDNIVVLEQGFSPQNLRQDIIRPESSLSYYIDTLLQQHIRDSNNPNPNAQQKGAALKAIEDIIEAEADPTYNYMVSMTRAIDNLNRKGLKIGILPERDVYWSQDIKSFFTGKLTPDFNKFKTLMDQIWNYMNARDMALAEKIDEISNKNSGNSLNIYIPRGRAHSGLLDRLQISHRESVRYAISNDISDQGFLDQYHRMRRSGREISEGMMRTLYIRYNRIILGSSI